MLILILFTYFQILVYIETLKFNVHDNIIKNYSIQSTKITKNSFNHECPYELFISLDEHYCKLCLIVTDKLENNFITHKTPIYILENNRTEVKYLVELGLKFVIGYIRNFKLSSKVKGFVENNNFYGRIELLGQIYYVEKSCNFPKYGQEKCFERSIIYRGSEYFMYDDIQYVQFKAKKTGRFRNICWILVIIDYSFYKYVGKSDKNVATSIVLKSLKLADSSFRSTDFDFDGNPDNVGFQIKEIILNKTPGDSYFPPYSTQPMSHTDLMLKVSRYPKLQTVCVGIYFTAQELPEKIIGVSFTARPAEMDELGRVIFHGGFCMTGQHSYNVVIISYFNMGMKIPQVISDISLLHELGHSFGSKHDSGLCDGFVMSQQASLELIPNTFKFSPCSREQIYEVLKERQICLDSHHDPYCGNALVEEGEECDCGSYYMCIYNDKCCNHYLSNEKCKINRSDGYECHPSSGLCCTIQCKLLDIHHLGLTCEKFERKCNPSSGPKELCGIYSTCLNDECHNIECTRIGLKECQCKLPENKKGCRICCYLNDQCVNAEEATEHQLNLFPSYLKNLIDSTKGELDIVKKICVGQECVNTTFKLFAHGDYCLYFGELGMCSQNICQLKERNQMMHLGATESPNEKNSAACIPRKLHVIYISLQLILPIFKIK